eukprot:5924044-Prymnesium_polylepis.1
MKERIKAQGKGKDPKALDAEIERQRREAAEKRAEQKRMEKERLKEENKQFEVRPRRGQSACRVPRAKSPAAGVHPACALESDRAVVRARVSAGAQGGDGDAHVGQPVCGGGGDAAGGGGGVGGGQGGGAQAAGDTQRRAGTDQKGDGRGDGGVAERGGG